jgi:hypothetical protein
VSDDDLQRLERRLKTLFDAFENNTTRVVGGLHEDLEGLRCELDRLATWIPGEAPENPLAMAAAMATNYEDRERVHHDMRTVWRWLAALSALLIAERTIWSGLAWWWLRRRFRERG